MQELKDPEGKVPSKTGSHGWAPVPFATKLKLKLKLKLLPTPSLHPATMLLLTRATLKAPTPRATAPTLR